jgi:formylglycine-generating enzyme required for sulfatase activity
MSGKNLVEIKKGEKEKKTKKLILLLLAVVMTISIFIVAIPTTLSAASNTKLKGVCDQYSETFKSAISGEEYEIIKNIPEETVQYRDQSGNCYSSKEEIFNKEMKELSIDANLLKLDEDLREMVMNGDKNRTVPVIVAFVNQPSHDISIRVKEVYKAHFENITAPARKAYARIKPLLVKEEKLQVKGLSEIVDTEQALLTAEEKRMLNETGIKLEQKMTQMRRDIHARAESIVDRVQAPAIDKMKNNGCKIKYSGKIYNSITADVPVSYLDELAKSHSVAMIYYDKILNATLSLGPVTAPVTSEDTNIKAIYADYWWDHGYTGGIWDVAVVDSGIDGSHPSLIEPRRAKVFHSTAKTSHIYNGDSSTSDDLLGHGTFCAGIIASQDSKCKGVAYGLKSVINAKAGWRGTDNRGHMSVGDLMEAIDWAIFPFGRISSSHIHYRETLNTCMEFVEMPKADVISCSFGGDSGADGDTFLCHYLNAVVSDLDIPVVLPAGNDGNKAYTIHEPGSAYNVITVGAIDDKNTTSRYDDSIWRKSSRGPTRDKRIKPDITAPGVDILSCYPEALGGKFAHGTGTSFASPHIAGSILLIMDYKNRDAKALKALLLNTAEDKGDSGPDNTYGFGYVDLKQAYIHKDDVHCGSLNDKPEAEVEKFYRGRADRGDTATLVWNRHVTYSGAKYPTSYLDLSDLNIHMYNEANNDEIDSSTSSINNVEQIESDAYYSSAIIKIEPFGVYPAGITSEDYALATEDWFSEVDPPKLSANIIAITRSVSSNATIFNASVRVTNIGDIKAHAVKATLNMPLGFTNVSDVKPKNLGIINGGSSKTVTWTVRASSVNVSQNQTISTEVDSSSYGESYSARDSVSANDSVSTTPVSQTIFTNTIGMEFVPIAAGEFEMGSPLDEAGRWIDEGPVHHVNIENAFYMGRYEVTQQQWHEIMDDNPSGFTGDDDLPVERVSWDNVQEFIEKLNEREGTDKYRLPSEAEWEYACRAGTTTRYSFGDSESELGDYAWYNYNSESKTHPVGQKKPNLWGLYDMHGNVWEWVQDISYGSYNGAPSDGSAWESGDGAYRVARGGGWGGVAKLCRSAAREYCDPRGRGSGLGFRILREQ